MNFYDEMTEDNNFFKNSFTPELNNFQQYYENNMSNYLGLKEENESFSRKFKISKKIQNSISNPSKKSESPFQHTFADLISKYKLNGYKIKDLSKKNNLFEPTPLLLDGPKIVNSFQFNQNLNCYEKDFDYLNKIGDNINEKIMTDKNFGNHKLARKMTGIDVRSLKNEKTKEEILLEIENGIKQINISNNLLESGNYKLVYSLPIIGKLYK